MRARVVALALPVAIGIGVAVTACGGSSGTAKPAASDGRPASGTASPAADATAPGQGGPAAAGYARIGGPAQGISVEAPKSWVAVNLAKESIEKAAQRVALKGLSASTVAQAMESLQKMHGVVVFDVKTAESNPPH
ncbi:MAG: hypothetical protein J2P26_14555, partial [Nocardiopsaceae bacterium]|nr:hypothetical protein [Nocardiopsaceae bacterium]